MANLFLKNDARHGLDSPFQFKGAIALSSDFPTLAEVEPGWLYTCTADVTDNDPTKTNTGQSFDNGDEIVWDGSGWVIVGNELAISAPPIAQKEVEGAIMSSMQGMILKITVKKVDRIKEGDVVLTVEAMKMEQEIFSERDGEVKEIFVKEGDSVQKGDILMQIL